MAIWIRGAGHLASRTKIRGRVPYYFTAHVGNAQYTFELLRPVKVGEQVTTHDGHWLVVQEIVQQAEATKAGIVKAKHAEPV